RARHPGDPARDPCRARLGALAARAHHGGRRARARRPHAANLDVLHPARAGCAAHRAGDLHLRLGHPVRGVPVVPRRRHAAPHPVVGQHHGRGQDVRAARVLDHPVPRPLPRADRPRHQPRRRRAARDARRALTRRGASPPSSSEGASTAPSETPPRTGFGGRRPGGKWHVWCASLLSIPAGVLADRASRRRLMAGAEALRALSLAGVLTLAHLNLLTLPLLALLGFIGACGTVAYSVAAPALVPALVPAGALAAANGRIELARTVAFAGGPALAGALVGWTGGAPAFGVAAGLSAAAVVLLAGVR